MTFVVAGASEWPDSVSIHSRRDCLLLLTNDTSRITKKRGSAKYRRQFTAVWLESPTILTVSTSSCWTLEHDSIGTDIDSFLGSHNSKLGAGHDQFVSQVEIQQQTNLASKQTVQDIRIRSVTIDRLRLLVSRKRGKTVCKIRGEILSVIRRVSINTVDLVGYRY